MVKGLSFAEKDEELVKEIIKFQKAQRLPTFVEAVRVLCASGLIFNTAVQQLK